MYYIPTYLSKSIYCIQAPDDIRTQQGPYICTIYLPIYLYIVYKRQMICTYKARSRHMYYIPTYISIYCIQAPDDIRTQQGLDIYTIYLPIYIYIVYKRQMICTYTARSRHIYYMYIPIHRSIYYIYSCVSVKHTHLVVV